MRPPATEAASVVAVGVVQAEKARPLIHPLVSPLTSSAASPQQLPARLTTSSAGHPLLLLLLLLEVLLLPRMHSASSSYSLTGSFSVSSRCRSCWRVLGAAAVDRKERRAAGFCTRSFSAALLLVGFGCALLHPVSVRFALC